MSAPKINDILQDDNLKICTQVVSGVRELEMACNHQVVGQLMRQALMTQLGTIPYAPLFGFDWTHYLSTDAQYQFLQTDLTAAMSAVYGVSSINIGAASFETTPFLEVGPLCWTTDCANSTSCESISI